MTAPKPPDHFSPPARAAWHRIYGRLAARGVWEPIYEVMMGMAAVQCAHYLEFAEYPNVDPAQLEETRLLARLALEQMEWIEPGRVNLASLTADGLDADIVDLCKPLKGENHA